MTSTNEFIQAAKTGDLAEVIYGLNDGRVDPAANNNAALRGSMKNGHTEIFKVLLQDPRINPADWDNVALRWVAKRGYTDMVEMLLQDPRINPAAMNHAALRNAANNLDNMEILTMLLYDPRTWYTPPNITSPEFRHVRDFLENYLDSAAAAIYAFKLYGTSQWLYDPALDNIVEQYLPIELYRVLEHRLRTGVYEPALLDAWIQRLRAA